MAGPFEAALAPAGAELFDPGRLEGRGPRFALGHTSGELAALGRLLARGVAVRWALDPSEEAGRSFPAGTLLVPGSARRLLEPLVAQLGFTARSVRSRPRSLALRTPRVGL